MIIRLANGTELECISAMGKGGTITGVYRDGITFVFDDRYTLDEIDALFTEENCERIELDGTRDEGEEVGVLNAYTMKGELKKTHVKVANETPDEPQKDVIRITIQMLQRTYAETQMKRLVDESLVTQLAVAELASMM